MPTKKKLALRELPNIPKELLEQFANGPMTAEAIEYASAALKKALIQRMLDHVPRQGGGGRQVYGYNSRRTMQISANHVVLRLIDQSRLDG
jgi:hypothetical protein